VVRTRLNLKLSETEVKFLRCKTEELSFTSFAPKRNSSRFKQRNEKETKRERSEAMRKMSVSMSVSVSVSDLHSDPHGSESLFFAQIDQCSRVFHFILPDPDTDPNSP
jgi:hypothetical protein